MTLKVPFLHAKRECIFLWNLEICNNNLYAFQKIYESKIPFYFRCNFMVRPSLYSAPEELIRNKKQ
ncbi:hypothetical protein AB4K20DRAFT_1922101 [Rhizopus microsporus]|uniref:Uncharacterized protein n=1 Tax=Rhizopus microsporus TaxID=58291 RepID=A0A1X0S9V4_RHIZD|nr:hypothetical protein BCV71DRAFT_225368 [Rhizopus microsporus]